MTQLALLADPPREGLVLERIAEGTVLSEGEAADLYEASLKDAVRTGATSGAELLVNYRPDDAIPEKYHGDDSAEQGVREVVEAAMAEITDDPHVESPRYEPQVGSTFSGRVGNTVTYLLEDEGATGVGVLRPTVPIVGRKEIDAAAIKLRRSEVVLGPAPGGRTFYAGFKEPIDFEAAYTPPELETLTTRAGDSGFEVDFVDTFPTVATPADLATTVSLIRSHVAADKPVPAHTAEFVLDAGLGVREDDGEPTVVRE
jgi:2-phospho-L-lactate guanylyltransferase (CobY/MobA/RfbA family)